MLVNLLHVRRLAANDKAISMERSWTLTISAATFNFAQAAVFKRPLVGRDEQPGKGVSP